MAFLLIVSDKKTAAFFYVIYGFGIYAKVLFMSEQ